MLTTFPAENQYIQKEQTNGQGYSSLAYYLGRFLAEVPIQIFLPVMYGSILYWSVNLNNQVERFGWFLLILTVQGLCSTAFGFAISAVSATEQVSE